MMNKTLLFLTAALVLGQAAAAQDTRSLAGESAYRYDNTLQLWRHTANAAAMGIDSLRDRGRVQMSAGRHAGSYHRVQEGSAQNGLSLYTERYQHMGRYLYGYGSFAFDKGRIEDRAWSDVMRTYESDPYLSGSSVSGRYDYQGFELTARVGTVSLNGWRVGTEGRYRVADLSRLRDPRSRSRLLDYRLAPSVTYTAGSHHTIGLTSYYRRRKESLPTLTTVQNDPNLYYYQMSGLDAVSGTVGGYSGFAREYVAHIFGAEGAYGYHSGGLHSVNTVHIERLSEGIYEQYRREPGHYYAYRYGIQSLNRIAGRSAIHQIDLQAGYRQDYADEYRPQLVITTDPATGYNSYRYDNLLTYRKRYQLTAASAQLHYCASLIRHQEVRSYMGLTLRLRQVEQKHLLPQSRFSRRTMYSAAEYGQGLLANNRLWLTALVGYQTTPKAELSMGTPDTEYAREVWLSDMGYYAANYWRGAISVMYQLPVTVKKTRSLWYIKAYAENLRAQHALSSHTLGLTIGVFN